MVKKRRPGKWYVDFFREGFYHRWAQAARFDRAEQEVEFIVRVLNLPERARILDLCCGEGRHTIALARRGYQMTGLDLTALHLRMARRAAKEADVEVRWHRADMRDIPWTEEFDAVINIFTSFGYLESEEEDHKVLQAVARALRPGGRFLIDLINRERLMRHWQDRDWQEGPDGVLYLEERRLDFLTSRNRVRILTIFADGTRDEHQIDLRLYTLTELAGMLSRAGLSLRGVWGGFDSSDYSVDSRRMIVLAEKED